MHNKQSSVALTSDVSSDSEELDSQVLKIIQANKNEETKELTTIETKETIKEEVQEKIEKETT